MQDGKPGYRSIDEYIMTFPKEVQGVLQGLRETISAAAPGAEERISYNMPAFRLKGNLVYFAAYKNHIGLYPMPRAIEAFKKELSVYGSGKGTVRFPIDKPLPRALISKIVRFRVSENLRKDKDGLRKKK